jgi:DNA mismatch repair protein MutL
VGSIHVLDSRVADQIAAGEVVERPASVVKELVENAIDAGARHISIEVRGGGLERLTVVDDGYGMDAADAVLCFSRHATSKLANADDLLRIATFGFRGEALAAIASVARVRLLTRRPADAFASEVRVEGGRVAHVGEAGSASGTRIDVEDLFFNTPARRKFLKAARTEAGHVEEAIASTALCLPEVGFQLSFDGKPVLDLPPAAASLSDPLRIERAVKCLGKHVKPMLFPFEASTELLALSGYVVAPLETRRDLAGVHLAVNGRPVTDRGLVQAVRTAFRTLLEVGRQPIVALDIAIDPSFVDVNVHPRKAEVRFTDPRRVTGHVIALLSDFLAGTPWLRSSENALRPRVMLLSSTSTSATSTDGTGLSGPTLTGSTLTGAASPHVATAPHLAIAPPEAATALDPLAEHRERVRAALARFESARASSSSNAAFSALGPRPPSLLPVAGHGGAGSFTALRVVGQVGGTYLVLEAPEGMVMIDQHAAHERVVFERLRAKKSTSSSQPLLIPITIDLSSLEMSALDDAASRELLSSHGLVIEPFGAHTALIKAIPPGLDAKRADQIARDALAELATDAASSALDDRVDRVCAKLACHAAVRAGDALSPESVRALLRDLDAIDLGAHCPHGRPVVRTVRYGELATWFDRK